MKHRWIARHISEISEVPGAEEGEPSWLAVRQQFGIESFGVNLFVARSTGDRIVPEHSEQGPNSGGHEELYFVVSGVATFTVDGETFGAPAGMLGAVAPEVKRAAIAEEAGTTIVAVGGNPGTPYVLSQWERKWTSGRPEAAPGRGR